MQCYVLHCTAAKISGCSWDKGDGPVRGAAAAAAAGAGAGAGAGAAAATAAEAEDGLGLFF